MIRNSLSVDKSEFITVNTAIWQFLKNRTFNINIIGFHGDCLEDRECAEYFSYWFKLAEERYQEEQKQLPNYLNKINFN